MEVTYLNLAAERLGVTECQVLQDFIDDNKDVAFTFILSGKGDTCEEMVEFVDELKLQSQLMIYADIRAQRGV
jgi:hypothetical protein